MISMARIVEEYFTTVQETQSHSRYSVLINLRMELS